VCDAAAASREKEVAIATILVVEDHDMSRDMLGRRLERRKFAILFANDGTQAVAMAKKASPDLILMDVNLPVLNGLEATRKLKAAPETRSIPVIALTAHAELYDRDQCLQAGADDWEGKPVDFGILLAKIDTLLSARHTTAP
jgi:CheY-like chemotaxis protein